MRLPRLEHHHRLRDRLLIKVIGVVSRRRVPDVIRTLLYRRDFFGDAFSELTQGSLRGASAWTVGERELFASFTARLEACHF
ncbi:MAG: hypothetical protein H6709_14245 [Kofleriaceae bacterium]|nr:hypothetical protein [Kofleriaceae bacterium]MCB9573242.1 hypothetical protein [Kofleriaceae bacterium]